MWKDFQKSLNIKKKCFYLKTKKKKTSCKLVLKILRDNVLKNYSSKIQI